MKKPTVKCVQARPPQFGHATVIFALELGPIGAKELTKALDDIWSQLKRNAEINAQVFASQQIVPSVHMVLPGLLLKDVRERLEKEFPHARKLMPTTQEMSKDLWKQNH